MNKKRLLILQRTPYFDDLISKIEPSKNITVVGISVSSETQKKELLMKYPELNIFTDYDITHWDNTFVGQRDIINNYKSQLKVEHFLDRWYDCSAYVMCQYYSALSFWIYYFNNVGIDCIFVRDLEHGTPVDSIPIDLAIKTDIPVFIFEPILAKGDDTMLWNIRCYNTQEYINVSSLSQDQNAISIDDYLHAPVENNRIECQGNYSKLSSDYSSLLGLFKLRNKFLSENDFTLSYALYRIITNLIMVKCLKIYYQQHTTKYIQNSAPFIFYALHFEPEATILNRTVYNSQIYNIKMLSKKIPDGWVIYVKDHPNQFDLFKPTQLTHLLGLMSHFRNKRYYKELLSIKNVKLIDINISSKTLLQDAKIMGIATINGTIAYEALDKHIPVILFGAKTTPCGLIQSVISVDTEEDLDELSKKLEDERKNINAIDIDKELSQLHFLMTKTDGFLISPSALETLVLDAKRYATPHYKNNNRMNA